MLRSGHEPLPPVPRQRLRRRRSWSTAPTPALYGIWRWSSGLGGNPADPRPALRLAWRREREAKKAGIDWWETDPALSSRAARSALQEENRVYHLAVLWELEGEIRWCDNDQLAIRDATREVCPFCGQKTRVRPLTDVLVDLAAARGARLDFMRGENENTDTLRDEFGGIAGLTRF